MNYGGIDSGMRFEDSNYSEETYSYYYNGTLGANHDVTIVGWNDSYSASNFSQTPPGDGAFIIKNSWGTSWGDNGYFYISYYDSVIGCEDNVFFIAEPLNNYKNIYQYDPLGKTEEINTSQTDPTTGWGANIFTAKSNEVLKAVSFYTTDQNCNYVIDIYNNTGSQPIVQDGPVLTQKGIISNAGYNTVPLSSGIELIAGQNFSIVLKLTNPEYKYPISVEMPIANYSSHATANASESFASSDGKTWTDITKQYTNTNVCIKAFTDPVQTPIITWETADIAYGTALGTDLDAKASVSGTFEYTEEGKSVDSITVLSAGLHTLNATFTPTDSTDYTTASDTASINVTQATPTITWNNPADICQRMPLSYDQLDAAASPAAGTFYYNPDVGTVLSEGQHKPLNVTFVPVDSTNYTKASKTVYINVNQCPEKHGFFHQTEYSTFLPFQWG
jgi:hypothetical protein